MSKQQSRVRRAPLEGDQLFRLLVDRVRDYAIFALDPNGIVASWNAGAERIKGYRADEIIGHHFSRFYPEEAIRSGWPQTELEIAAARGRFEDEGWRVRNDGTRFWANVVITALYGDDGVLRGYAKVTRDLTERRRVERLEADARQVSQFVAMLAHELRNPLAPIRNAVALSRRQENPERTAWALEVIDRQSAHMSRMVDDLLDVSRITRGQLRIDRRRLAMHGIVDGAVDAVRTACEKRRHTIEVQHGEDGIVRGDQVRLAQILNNLLTNACKYTPAGGRIQIEAGVDGDHYRIAIHDTGIGIAPDLLPRLFDVFTQDDRALDRADGGLGLGLAIAKRLVEMHGGTLVAESAGPGCGSQFTVRLPVLAAGLHGADGSRLTVLVVDDNVDAAQMLEALLQAHGHHALVAYDGESGLRLAQEAIPDIILLDIGLPGMNGYELARAIRNTPELQGVALVAVTGYGSDEDRREAMESGFDAHLAKPVDYETLRQKVPLLEA